MEIYEYLSRLGEKDEVNVDFHNHGWTGREWGKGRVMEEGYENLLDLVNGLYETGLDILHLTNFRDEQKFEEGTSTQQLRELEDKGYNVKQGEYYIFIEKDGDVRVLGKSQEVPTKQGHSLAIGLRRGEMIECGRGLEETLEGEGLRGLDHPYSSLAGVGSLTYQKDNSGELVASIKSLYHTIKHALTGKVEKWQEGLIEKADFLEKNGICYLPISLSNYLSQKRGREYSKPVLSNADGHHPKDIGKTYNIFSSEDLNYQSEEEFRQSLHQAVRDNKFKSKFRPIPPHRIFHHIMMAKMYGLGDKIKGALEEIKSWF